jgi:uncharacterized protein YciI
MPDPIDPIDAIEPVEPALAPGRYALLLYEYVDDMAERRTPHRQAHLAHAARARAEGRLVNVGALGDAAEGAILVFADVDPTVLEQHAADDPYQVAGLIRSWRVVPWQVVPC